MKIRRIPLKGREAHCAVIYKTKCFKTEEEAHEWGRYVEQLLAAVSSAPRMGMTPRQAVEAFCGSAPAKSA